MNDLSQIQLSVIFDNISYSPSMITKWGYACIIKSEYNFVLFDTGSDGDVLLANMKLISLSPAEIDTVIISHDHWDHTGGLDAFLEINPAVTVYVPKSLSGQTATIIRRHGAKIKRVDSAMQLSEGIYSLGEMENERIPEQSIVISTPKGLVVMTGCAHPGIVNIIRRAQQEFPQENIYLAMGGFHLKNDNDDEIRSVVNELKLLGVQAVAPGHCTGDAGVVAFETVYQNNFIRSGAGCRIDL